MDSRIPIAEDIHFVGIVVEADGSPQPEDCECRRQLARQMAKRVREAE